MTGKDDSGQPVNVVRVTAPWTENGASWKTLGMSFDPQPTNLSPGPTTKPYGTGLGIPFAFKVVHAHGGDLHFTPGDGGGTRVTVTFPAGQSVAARA